MEDVGTVKGRLAVFRKYTKLTNEEFAKKVGLSQIFLSKAKDSINSTSIVKIARTFPDLNIYWLLGLDETGMLKSDNLMQLQKLFKENEEMKLKIIKQEGQIEILKSLLMNKKDDD